MALLELLAVVPTLSIVVAIVMFNASEHARG